MNSRLTRSLWTSLLISLLAHAALLAGSTSSGASGPGGVAPAFLQVVLKPSQVSKAASQWTDSLSPKSASPGATKAAEILSGKPLLAKVVPLSRALPERQVGMVAMAGMATTNEIPDNAIESAPQATSSVGQHFGHSREPQQTNGAAESSAWPDSEELRGFRLRLAVLASRFKNYPSLARERGWEGVVDVRVSLEPSVSTPEVTLARSSGIPLLDQAALGMMAQAVGVMEIPAPFQGRTVRVVLPVDYRLED